MKFNLKGTIILLAGVIAITLILHFVTPNNPLVGLIAGMLWAAIAPFFGVSVVRYEDR